MIRLSKPAIWLKYARRGSSLRLFSSNISPGDSSHDSTKNSSLDNPKLYDDDFMAQPTHTDPLSSGYDEHTNPLAPKFGGVHPNERSFYPHINPLDSTKRAASAIGNATLHYTHEFNKYYENLEDNLMKRINESNKQRFRLYFFITIAAIIWITYFFGERIRKKISEKTAGIAKETLENESLQFQTQELAMAVVQTILSDEEITAQAAKFLQHASSAPETQTALADLAIHIFQHKNSFDELMKLLSRLIEALSNDPEVMKQLTDLVYRLTENPRVKEALSKLFLDLSMNPKVIEAASALAIEVLNRANVTDATNNLLYNATMKLVDNPKVIEQSKEFITDVMGDDTIQRESGDALYNTVTHALTPGLRRIGGLGLVAISFGLVKLFLSPY